MRAREPNSWPIRYHRTWTRELAVSCPSRLQYYRLEVEDITSQLLMLLIQWTSGTTEWTFMTHCPSSLKTFLLRLQVRRTLKRVFLSAACLLLVAETEWPVKSLQMRACLKLNKKYWRAPDSGSGTTGHGGVPPLLQIAWHVEQRGANKKLTEVYCPPRKRSPKWLIVPVEP